MIVVYCNKCGKKLYEEVGAITKLTSPLNIIGEKLVCECGNEYKLSDLPGKFFGKVSKEIGD